MRLINASTYKLEEFYGDEIPLYAILSHRWGKEEVLFQDMESQQGRKKKGWTKIAKCCEVAKSHGWDYVWIDTCCIDKSSSAELSEAINSMFEWYAKAGVCYAFLSDVQLISKAEEESTKNYLLEHGLLISQPGPLAGYEPEASFQPEASYVAEGFMSSEWFRRGWTLQELLAPARMLFLDRDWAPIGNKQSLSSHISTAAHIAREHLFDFATASVAQKMSWASQRMTTRVEDEAYSLFGLFGIHMPLLYGEGKNAFLRLQLEILKISDDVSILAWDGLPSRNALAESIADFSHAERIKPTLDISYQPTLQMTSRGLVAEVMLYTDSNGGTFIPLNVHDIWSGSLALKLDVTTDGRYQRSSLLRNWNHDLATISSESTSICINQSLKRSIADLPVFHIAFHGTKSSARPLEVRHLPIASTIKTDPNLIYPHMAESNFKMRPFIAELPKPVSFESRKLSFELGELCFFHVDSSELIWSESILARSLPWPKFGFAFYAVGMMPCFKVWPCSLASVQDMIENLASAVHLKPRLPEGVIIQLDPLQGLASWVMIRVQLVRSPTGSTVELYLRYTIKSGLAPPGDVDCEVVRYHGCEITYFHRPKVPSSTTWFSQQWVERRGVVIGWGTQVP